MGTISNEISKQKFMNELIAKGYSTVYENGVPIALCKDKSEISNTVKAIREIAKKMGYNESLGVKVSKALSIPADTNVLDSISENTSIENNYDFE